MCNERDGCRESLGEHLPGAAAAPVIRPDGRDLGLMRRVWDIDVLELPPLQGPHEDSLRHPSP